MYILCVYLNAFYSIIMIYIFKYHFNSSKFGSSELYGTIGSIFKEVLSQNKKNTLFKTRKIKYRLAYIGKNNFKIIGAALFNHDVKGPNLTNTFPRFNLFY